MSYPTFATHSGEEVARRFGASVRRLLKEKGPSQERPGAISGLHRNYIEAIESAERTTSILVANRLARALGTTLANLFAKIEKGCDEDGNE